MGIAGLLASITLNHRMAISCIKHKTAGFFLDQVYCIMSSSRTTTPQNVFFITDSPNITIGIEGCPLNMALISGGQQLIEAGPAELGVRGVQLCAPI